MERNWIDKNPASGLKLPKEDHLPTLPFTAPEWEKILWACEVYPNKGIYGFDSWKRIRAFVLLLRYTGLRIGDVAAMRRGRIADGKLLVRRAKTKTVVHLPLPKIVLEALDVLPVQSGDYFFWSGNGLIKSSVADWQRTLRKLFPIAGIKEAHAHRFRDSFSVELLSRGVSIEIVSVLLGHSSIRITEKHYSPWVKTRQDALEEAVKEMWA